MTNAPMNYTNGDEPALHGVLVHCTASPGKLIRVDGMAARATGATVLTGQHLLDLDPYIGPVVRDQPLLAIDRVRYRGEPVALVLAADPDSARSAAALVTYEVGPLTPGATGAVNGQAPLVHLIEMLRPGPSPLERLIVPNRTNDLIARVAMIDSIDGADTDPGHGVDLFERPAQWNGEVLEAAAAIDGARVTLRSGVSGHSTDQLAQLFDPIGLGIERTPGLSTAPVGPAIDALAIAAARSTRRPVRLTAEFEDFRWSGPRGRLEVGGAEVALSINAGAVVGSLPLWIDQLTAHLGERFHAGTVAVTITYSASPPIAATLDDWREALAWV